LEQSLHNRKPNLVKPTLIFAVVGIFIPGFSAIAILGFQKLLSSFGHECHDAWKVLWTITIIGAIALPILFYRHVRNLTESKLEILVFTLSIFNIIEYTFIQASLARLFTNAETLCYVTDGQNGIELAFTAWFAIPVLVVLSILFGQVMKLKNV